MKRRRLLQSLAALPAVGVIPLAAQSAAQPAPAPAGFPVTLTQADSVAQPSPHFFSADQRRALERLGDLLVPKSGDRPGAREAQAPAFLEFLISQSPQDRQKLYLDGLDRLNAQSFATASET